MIITYLSEVKIPTGQAKLKTPQQGARGFNRIVTVLTIALVLLSCSYEDSHDMRDFPFDKINFEEAINFVDR